MHIGDLGDLQWYSEGIGEFWSILPRFLRSCNIVENLLSPHQTRVAFSSWRIEMSTALELWRIETRTPNVICSSLSVPEGRHYFKNLCPKLLRNIFDCMYGFEGVSYRGETSIRMY